MKIRNIDTRTLALSGIVAATYVVATIAIAPLAYGPIQFRISEIMVLLAFLDPIYAPGLIVGCLIANLLSPYGLPDIIIGTLATALSVLAIINTKKLLIATLWPVLINGVLIGLLLYFFAGLPFFISMLQVMAGEFVVVTVVGYPAFTAISKYRHLLSEKIKRE